MRRVYLMFKNTLLYFSFNSPSRRLPALLQARRRPPQRLVAISWELESWLQGLTPMPPPRLSRIESSRRLQSQQRSAHHVTSTENFTGLVLRCIEAKFCKKIWVWRRPPRSTQCTHLHRSQCSKFSSKIAEFLLFVAKFSPNSVKFQNLTKFR